MSALSNGLFDLPGLFGPKRPTVVGSESNSTSTTQMSDGSVTKQTVKSTITSDYTLHGEIDTEVIKDGKVIKHEHMVGTIRSDGSLELVVDSTETRTVAGRTLTIETPKRTYTLSAPPQKTKNSSVLDLLGAFFGPMGDDAGYGSRRSYRDEMAGAYGNPFGGPGDGNAYGFDRR